MVPEWGVELKNKLNRLSSSEKRAQNDLTFEVEL